MGGRLEPGRNRVIDRLNKTWLEARTGYDYRWTTTGLQIKPEHISHLGVDFIRVPFPGKNQVVWGFENYANLARFKSWLETSQ